MRRDTIGLVKGEKTFEAPKYEDKGDARNWNYISSYKNKSKYEIRSSVFVILV